MGKMKEVGMEEQQREEALAELQVLLEKHNLVEYANEMYAEKEFAHVLFLLKEKLTLLGESCETLIDGLIDEVMNAKVPEAGLSRECCGSEECACGESCEVVDTEVEATKVESQDEVA